MTIYNYDKTKAVYIPTNAAVSIECKKSGKFLSSFGGINPHPALMSMVINGTIMWARSLTHEKRDNLREGLNVGDFYTEEEELMEAEKAKLMVKQIIEKLQEGNHNNAEYYISEEGYLKELN